MSSWYVYMVRCVDQTLYTGVTTDLERRLREHNECNRTGARYTRARRPVTLAWHEAQTDRAQATRREAVIKRMSRQCKDELIEQACSRTTS